MDPLMNQQYPLQIWVRHTARTCRKPERVFLARIRPDKRSSNRSLRSLLLSVIGTHILGCLSLAVAQQGDQQDAGEHLTTTSIRFDRVLCTHASVVSGAWWLPLFAVDQMTKANTVLKRHVRFS